MKEFYVKSETVLNDRIIKVGSVINSNEDLNVAYPHIFELICTKNDKPADEEPVDVGEGASNIGNMKKADLIEFAKSLGIDASSKMTVSEITKAIQEKNESPEEGDGEEGKNNENSETEE